MGRGEITHTKQNRKGENAAKLRVLIQTPKKEYMLQNLQNP